MKHTQQDFPLQIVGTVEAPETAAGLEALQNGAADGVRTHDNWNHNPISSSVVALESASIRGHTVPIHSHTRQKTN